MFGKPVPVMEDEVGQIVIGKENLDGERKPGKAVDLDGGEYRRSIYIQFRRSRVLSFFDTFDAPELNPNCSQRNVSTVAPQALAFLNGEFVIDHVRRTARLLLKPDEPSREERLIAAWRRVLARDPSSQELQWAEDFLSRQIGYHGKADGAESRLLAWSELCHALLSSNEFVYVD